MWKGTASWRKRGVRLGMTLLVLTLVGCASVHRNPVPIPLQAKAGIDGMPGIRTWHDVRDPVFHAHLVDAMRQDKGLCSSDSDQRQPSINLLAISGGGADGAYGAGILCGWTKAGTRPEFKFVTGVSTGALMAPFAFLGPEYDEQLKEFYTTITGKDVYQVKNLLGSIGTDSLADTRPLRKLLARAFDENVLRKITVEYAKGRRLYVGTANLDAQRPTIWDLSAIAASGHPKALELFHNVLVASAAIPVAFPPVYVSVQVDGKTYDEMHVDGGVITQVFVVGRVIDLRAVGKEAGLAQPLPPIRLFIIRNAKVTPVPRNIEPGLVKIAARSLETMIGTQGIGDLYRIYVYAQRDKIDYNLAAIPDDFDESRDEEFDTKIMNQLFEVGFNQARKGYPWQKSPPWFTPQ